MAGKRTPKAFPWVTPEYCEGCADCLSACPRQCLTMEETRHDGVLIPWINDVSACTGCGKCEAACTWAAIALTSYVDEAMARFAGRGPLKPAAA
jgi:Formate hydrogenlyase subunit 6/NADH:ubiquinone oxidoreductase 23 kD subunit (chain I)